MTKCRNCWEIDSSVWVKQHYSAGFKHFCFFYPSGKNPQLELWTRSDLAKTMLECPPLAQLRQGTEGLLLYSQNRRRLKGGNQNLNIWANVECLDQNLLTIILHSDGHNSCPLSSSASLWCEIPSGSQLVRKSLEIIKLSFLVLSKLCLKVDNE